MYRISEFITPEERLDAMRLGGLRKMASLGLKPSDLDALVKSSADSGSKMDILGSVLKTSILIGAPLGAVWYAISSGIKKDSKKTKKLKATLDHYNDIVSENRNRLQGVFPGQ